MKQKVWEGIWKVEYVEIFSLLPLKRFNLDRAGGEKIRKGERSRFF